MTSSSIFAGQIANGVSRVGITKSGSGTLTLDGVNPFSGGTLVKAGSLVIGNAGALGSGGVSLADGVRLAFAVPMSFANSIVFAGAVGARLDTGDNTIDLVGDVSGAGALIKIGSGTLTVDGVNAGVSNNGHPGKNTYTGGTFVNAGTLVVGAAGALGSGAVTLANGVTLGFAGPMSLANSIAFSGSVGATLDTGAANVALSGVISGPGALTKIGAGTLTLDGANTFAGGTFLDAGSLVIANSQALGSGALSMAKNTTLGFAGAANVSNAILFAGSSDPTIDTGSARVTLSGVISGPGALTKIGTGTLTLDGANTFAGGTFVNAGTLVVGAAGALGPSAVTLANGVTLGFAGPMSVANSIAFSGGVGANLDTGAANVALSGVVSGPGGLTKIGSGTLTLDGANTFAGGTFVNAGTLVVGAAGTLGSGAVTLANGVTLGFAGPRSLANSIAFSGGVGANLDTGAANVALSGVISGPGALTKIGAGTLTLDGANTFAGGTFLDAGSLVIANSQALGSGTLSMADNTTLGFAGAANLSNAILFAGYADPTIDTGSARVTLSGVISGPGALTKVGLGTLVLSGADTYAGATLVSQGTLEVDGSIVSATTVSQGATLSGMGVVGGVAVLPGGALAPGNASSPYGALRATGNVSFASSSTYLVTFNPAATSLLSTSGAASVAGAVAATWTGGTPIGGARYTILTASDGVKGTFSSLTFQGLSTNLPVLAYDANDVYLVFSGPGNAAVQASLQKLAGDRQGAMITNQVLTSVLGGINEQINCTNCVSGFGSVGSLSAGVHGRLTLNANLALLGGAAFSQYQSGGVNVTSAPLFLAALRYDKTEWGSSRPFAEIGVSASPWQQVSYTRSYDDAGTARWGRGASTADDFATFGKLGWLTRFSPIDEAAVHIAVYRTWQIVGGYTESVANNPAPATIAGGTDLMNIAGVGGQWTHLFGQNLETQIGLGLEQSFGSRSGVSGAVAGFSSGVIGAGEYHWVDYGVRLGYRIGNGFVADIFADGTLGAQPVGNTIHGGLGLRYAL